MTKKILTYAGIVLLFLVLAYSFVPQVLTGKIVNQSDISGYLGMAHESNVWDAEHPDNKTAWTNSMFGGMPTTMLSGNTEGDWTQKIYNLFLTGRRPASYLFISLLGAFLMLLAMGIHPLIAAGGAVAVTFCSYNMQIIQVGHNSKMLALAWAPWVMAGVLFTYRKALNTKEKWLPWALLGAALFAMALNFQIKANHVQISYYLAIIIFSYVIALLIWLVRSRKELIGRFFIVSALLLVLGVIGIGANANRLIPTWKYTQHTMRGGSELSTDGGKSKGLDLDYATSWSYGWEELPNLMVPNFNGGSSAGELPMDSETVSLLRDSGQSNLTQVAKQLPLYWGPQPYTAGPMYMGAITVFLFVLGLMLCRGKDRWWLLAATLIGIGLALGSHFMGFTKFWYYHMPFYSKFRSVSMALVILQMTLPMLGFLVLDRIVKEEYDRQAFMRKGLIAFALTGGFCFLCVLFPGIAGTFSGPVDANQPDILVQALMADRAVLLRKDALMALILIALTLGLLVWAYQPKEASSVRGRRVTAAIAISLMVLINMFSIGKRYLNSSHFVSEREFKGQFALRDADKLILQDQDPDYRVLDLSVSVFNDSYPSYFHKNIGGYSPVKLQRYQDLIEQYLTPEINSIYGAVQGSATVGEVQEKLPELPVLSMLNDKYIILDGGIAPVVNPNAYGHAWFVSGAVRTETPDEEISVLGGTDLRNNAVLGPDFASVEIPADTSAASIDLLIYEPNRLVYKYSAEADRAAVFSEIYYPDGWTATLEDGTPVDIFRADWTLRGAVLPAGNHELTMSFQPKSYVVSSRISRTSSILLILLLLASTGAIISSNKKQ